MRTETERKEWCRIASSDDLDDDDFAELAEAVLALDEDLTDLLVENVVLSRREPTADEMERALGTGEEAFIGGTVRRCRVCRCPVFGGPTACVRCVEREVATKPVAMRITCPDCGVLHVDEGAFATKPHHTHSCQACGLTWRPAVAATVGVRFLPGFKDMK